MPKPRVSLDEFKVLQAFSVDAQRLKNQSKLPESTKSALDAFNNTLARIGQGTNNLLEGTSYPLTRLSYNWFLLISLYRDNWIASKLIDAIAEDMCKNWLSFTTELPPTKLKRIEQAITHTATQDRVMQALKWARLFGGAGAVMIIKGQKPSAPLDLDDVPLDSYRGLIVFDRWSGISPNGTASTNLDRPLDFGLPESYRVTAEGGRSFDVHASRVLRFTGRIMPAYEFQADQRWGVSEIERVYTELKKRDNTSYNLASLIFRANIFELRQKGLASMISGISGGGQQAMQQFWSVIQAQAQLMNNQGIVVSDPEGGGLSTHQYGFAGIADVYMQFMLDICGACEIPFSRLFGRGASGLGQTGEGDEHVYYEMIGQRQRRELDPQMMKLLPVVSMSTWGKIPADFEWKWNPVNSPSDKEKAELAKSNTDAIAVAYNAGLLWKSTAKKELKQQSSITQLFSNISDDEQEQAEDEDAGAGELGLGREELSLSGGKEPVEAEGKKKPKQLTAGDAEFIESEHPRGSEGTSKGGQFVKKGEEGSASARKEIKVQPIPKAAAEQINRILARPEMKEKVLNAYKADRKMGSIASTVGLPRDKAARAALRRLLRKEGIYKENGGWVKEGQVDVGFGERLARNLNEIEKHLGESPISHTKSLGGGVNLTEIVVFGDGTKGIFKPHSGEYGGARPGYISDGFQTEREVGAWEVAKLVGMEDIITPTIERTYEGQRGALLEFNEGSVAAKADREKRYDGDQDLAKLAAFDFVIGNMDRHEFNWMVTPEGKLKGIDHGLAFPDKKPYRGVNDRIIKEAVVRTGNNRDIWGVAWKKKDSTFPRPKDLAVSYSQNEGKIVEALTRIGLPQAAVEGVRRRIGILASSRSWDLKDSL